MCVTVQCERSDSNALLEYCFLNAVVVVVVFLHVALPEDYRGRWETFVDQTLSETNRKNTIDLVNTHDHLQYVIAVFNYTHIQTSNVMYFFSRSRLALETHAHPQRMIWRAPSLKN